MFDCQRWDGYNGKWCGRVAQLGERRLRTAEVGGSNPLPSTMS